MRGGVSSLQPVRQINPRSSPRAWGCFLISIITNFIFIVFPTCVGVFLRGADSAVGYRRLPHVRGGVSSAMRKAELFILSSPRAWGCFRPCALRKSHDRVFPTCVGVFQTTLPASAAASGLPHVRGGVSGRGAMTQPCTQSSPRAWGCFSGIPAWRVLSGVFPTCVGVFPSTIISVSFSAGLPHVRGGVSGYFVTAWIGCPSSPRAWGCF